MTLRLVTTTLVTGSNQSTRTSAVIDFNKSKQYTLSIRLSTDGFCFAIHNPLIDNEYAYHPYKIDAHKSIGANLKSAIEELALLKHTYATVNILFANTAYTIVPKEFYAEQCAHDLYAQNFPQAATTEILSNIVGDDQAVVLFSMESQLRKLITERFPKANIYASISPLINYASEKSFTNNKRFCFVHLHKHYADVLCFNNGAPLLINTFNGNDIADVPYFLLNCWQMLGLSQTDDTLYVASNTRNTKTLIKELNRFIQNIHLLRPAEEFHSTELARIDELPFDLQALIACE